MSDTYYIPLWFDRAPHPREFAAAVWEEVDKFCAERGLRKPDEVSTAEDNERRPFWFRIKFTT